MYSHTRIYISLVWSQGIIVVEIADIFKWLSDEGIIALMWMLAKDTLSGAPKDTEQEQECDCQRTGKAQSCEECSPSSQSALI